MIFKNAMKWLKEKLSGKKKDNTIDLPDITAKDATIEAMKIKSTIMAPIVASQIGRAQWLEKEAEQIAEITQNTTEEVREEILKISTETGATTEEAVERVRERKLEEATAQMDSCKRQIIMSNNERRRKGIPMVRRQQ